ncbi:uncharacterized protein LOC112084357 [Eutrema salsugineum]|uniref:uncharacterized protein LOC112084357 n=1 Tax=Eutrema salsugineum TaxID=72664 RepID=UPI000CED7533|nr:uncharacterized protein LOC112084357 [Eutrema salsugineum]
MTAPEAEVDSQKESDQVQEESSKSSWDNVVKKIPSLSKVIVPDDVIGDDPLWENLLGGRFLATAPHIAKDHVMVNKIWPLGDKTIKVDVFEVNSNTMRFRIRDARVRNRVFRRGTWNIADIPMVISKCSPIKEPPPEISTIPIWVILKNVPYLMFSWKGLGFLSIAVRVPKRLHPNTELCKKYEEAKVFVEADLSKPLPTSHCFEIQSEDVENEYMYPWIPSRCSKCSKWGHLEDVCLPKSGNVRILKRGTRENLVSTEVAEVEKVPESQLTPAKSGQKSRNVEDEGNEELESNKGKEHEEDMLVAAALRNPAETIPQTNVSAEMEEGELQAEDQTDKMREKRMRLAIDDRRELWGALRAHQDSPMIRNKPWILLGDYNEIFDGEEHSEFANSPTISAGMRDFQEMVTNFWSNTPTLFNSTSALFQFSKKLKNLKPILKEMRKSSVGDLTKKTKEAYSALCEKQQTVAKLEENFLKQRSKLHWLNTGDGNNKVFHLAAQTREIRNSIRDIHFPNGVIAKSSTDIKAEAESFFRQFLQAVLTEFEGASEDRLAELLQFQVSDTDCSLLTRAVTDDEVRDVLFKMPANKSPGPDGFTSELFKAAWPVVGKDFTVAVQSFFTKSFLPKGINTMILAPIPKKEDAKEMKYYHPCILLKFIAPNQSAFIKDRLLVENLLLATELVKDYHKADIFPRSAVKIDISKAFDTLQWPFLLNTLAALNFPAIFIHWIKLCVTRASFSVQVNGELAWFLKS